VSANEMIEGSVRAARIGLLGVVALSSTAAIASELKVQGVGLGVSLSEVEKNFGQKFECKKSRRTW